MDFMQTKDKDNNEQMVDIISRMINTFREKIQREYKLYPIKLSH